MKIKCSCNDIIDTETIGIGIFSHIGHRIVDVVDTKLNKEMMDGCLDAFHKEAERIDNLEDIQR